MKLTRVWPVQIEGYSYRDLSPSALFSLVLPKEYLKFAKPEKSARFIPSCEILHPDILEFIYFQVNASRKATGVLCTYNTLNPSLFSTPEMLVRWAIIRGWGDFSEELVKAEISKVFTTQRIVFQGTSLCLKLMKGKACGGIGLMQMMLKLWMLSVVTRTVTCVPVTN